MIRVGKDLMDDFGPPRIHPSLPGSLFFLPRKTWGWYLFAGIDARAVTHDIFLDGNTNGDNLHVDRKPLVADLQVGMALTVGWFHITYTQVFRSKQFDQQISADRFGALSLSIKY